MSMKVFLWFYGHGGEMVSVIALIAVNRGFEPRSGQAKDYILCCFSTVVTVDLDYKNQTTRVGVVQSCPFLSHHRM